jgi:hypothetical protein
MSSRNVVLRFEAGQPMRSHQGPGIEPHKHGGFHRETDADFMQAWREVCGKKSAEEVAEALRELKRIREEEP